MAKSKRPSRAALFVVDRTAGGAITNSLQGILTRFTKDIQDKVVRPAVRAGALVFLDEMKQRAPVGDKLDSTKENYEPGKLKNSIYHYYDTKISLNGRHVYYVGPNKNKAPHWYFAEYGHYIVNRTTRNESGQIFAFKDRLPEKVFWNPAQPYIRPTWEAKSADAIAAMQRRLMEKLGELQSTEYSG